MQTISKIIYYAMGMITLMMAIIFSSVLQNKFYMILTPMAIGFLGYLLTDYVVEKFIDDGDKE